ncbi:MAG: SAM-dependent methyltransferase, partial [Gemmatimonadota bacterium]
AMLALALLAPLAFSMGMPFPLGLQRVADRRPDWIPWCWGVNGVLSVIGAAAAPLVALAVGFRGVLLLSAALYVLAGWILSRINTRIC